MLFVDAARIYSLETSIPHTNTCDRLREFARRRGVDPLEVQAWVDAFLFIQILRLRKQHAQIDAGEPLGNRQNPALLNELEGRVLKEALRQARRLQSRLAMDYRL
jgi:CBS domain-containing protein